MHFSKFSFWNLKRFMWTMWHLSRGGGEFWDQNSNTNLFKYPKNKCKISFLILRSIFVFFGFDRFFRNFRNSNFRFLKIFHQNQKDKNWSEHQETNFTFVFWMFKQIFITKTDQVLKEVWAYVMVESTEILRERLGSQRK